MNRGTLRHIAVSHPQLLEVAMTIQYALKLCATGVFAAGGIVAAIALSSTELRADPDRCPGMTQPVCKSVEKCVGVGSSRVCTTDYYYFPDPT